MYFLAWKVYFHSSGDRTCIGMAVTWQQGSPCITDDETYVRVQRKTHPAPGQTGFPRIDVFGWSRVPIFHNHSAIIEGVETVNVGQIVIKCWHALTMILILWTFKDYECPVCWCLVSICPVLRGQFSHLDRNINRKADIGFSVCALGIRGQMENWKWITTRKIPKYSAFSQYRFVHFSHVVIKHFTSSLYFHCI